MRPTPDSNARPRFPRERRAPLPRVLVAEDEQSIRESLVELFGDAAEVIAVATLAEALAALRAHTFDLIVSDLRLGAKRDGGFQIMAAAGLLSPDASVIVLTAYPDESSQAAAQRLGAAHFLAKPVDLERIASLATQLGVPVAFD